MYSNFQAQKYEFVDETIGNYLNEVKLDDEQRKELLALKAKTVLELSNLHKKETVMYKGMFGD